jgi:hypothetical protein
MTTNNPIWDENKLKQIANSAAFEKAHIILKEWMSLPERIEKANQEAIVKMLTPRTPTSSPNLSVDLTQKGQSDHTTHVTWEIKDEAIALPIETTYGFDPDSKEWGEMRDRGERLLNQMIVTQVQELGGAFSKATTADTAQGIAEAINEFDTELQMTESIAKVQEPSEAHYESAREILADLRNPTEDETANTSVQFFEALKQHFTEEAIAKGKLDDIYSCPSWMDEKYTVQVLFYPDLLLYGINLYVSPYWYSGSGATIADATKEAIKSIERKTLKSHAKST